MVNFFFCVTTVITLFFSSMVYSKQTSDPLEIVEVNNDAQPLSIPNTLIQQPRVVALNWSATEMLLSLGIQPVAMTSKKGYRKWQSNHPEIPDQVLEIGNRAFPNLPTIVQQNPDLIVGYPFRHARLLNELTEIAPTLLLQQFAHIDQPNYRYMQQMRENYITLAKRVGKAALAQQQLQEMDRELDRLRSLLAAANLQNKQLAYGKFVGMGYGLRVFSKQSLAASVITALGLDYQWDIALPSKDFTHLQLEQINMLQETGLILVKESAGKGERMMSSPLWSEHQFVKNDDIYTVSPLWSFGGPLSVIRMARAFASVLLEKQNAS